MTGYIKFKTYLTQKVITVTKKGIFVEKKKPQPLAYEKVTESHGIGNTRGPREFHPFNCK